MRTKKPRKFRDLDDRTVHWDEITPAQARMLMCVVEGFLMDANSAFLAGEGHEGPCTAEFMELKIQGCGDWISVSARTRRIPGPGRFIQQERAYHVTILRHGHLRSYATGPRGGRKVLGGRAACEPFSIIW